MWSCSAATRPARRRPGRRSTCRSRTSGASGTAARCNSTSSRTRAAGSRRSRTRRESAPPTSGVRHRTRKLDVLSTGPYLQAFLVAIQPCAGVRLVSGGYVVAEREVGSRPESGTAQARLTIDRSCGCERLEQRVLRFTPGRSAERQTRERQEVLYVAS